MINKKDSRAQGALAPVETRFAELIWERAPLQSAELVRLCEAEFAWKRSTTYTVLKRLCERGFFELSDGMVTVLTPRDEYFSGLSEQVVSESFSGSLPAFIAAFSRSKPLTAAEIAEIRAIIDGGSDAASGAGPDIQKTMASEVSSDIQKPTVSEVCRSSTFPRERSDRGISKGGSK